MRSLLLALGTAGIAVLALTTPASAPEPSPSGADGLLNPSFEVPDAPASSYTTFAGGQSFSGWRVTGSSVAIVDGSFVSGEYRFPAAAGEQWLDLSGETAGDGGVSQSVSIAPGRQYTLAWSVGNVSGGSFGTESSVRLLIDGDAVRTVTNSRPGTTLSWQEFTHTFTATANPTEIEFRTADPTSDHSNGLDRIRLVAGEMGPPQPTLGETAAARTVKGTVLIGVPSSGARAAQKGVDFVPLEEAREIPIGSFLDTTDGTVALSTAKNRAGKTQKGKFSAGLFQVLQSRKRAAKGLTELRMKGSAAGFRSCRGDKNSASAALSRRTIRRLRARARGRFRTRGRRSAATVRGTTWTVTDRCDGTLTKVKRGKVAVRDFRLKKTVVLTAGKSYLAR